MTFLLSFLCLVIKRKTESKVLREAVTLFTTFWNSPSHVSSTTTSTKHPATAWDRTLASKVLLQVARDVIFGELVSVLQTGCSDYSGIAG